MFIVDGEINFDDGVSCDNTDVVQGIFLATEGFTTSATRNDNAASSDWCMGGNLIIKGTLIGPGIDQDFYDQRRAVLDAWDTNAYLLFDGANDA